MPQDPTGDTGAPSHSQGRTTRLLVAVVVTAALAPLNSTMLLVAIPGIAERFGADEGFTTHALVTTHPDAVAAGVQGWLDRA